MLLVNDELNNLFLRYERFEKKRAAVEKSNVPQQVRKYLIIFTYVRGHLSFKLIFFLLLFFVYINIFTPLIILFQNVAESKPLIDLDDNTASFEKQLQGLSMYTCLVYNFKNLSLGKKINCYFRLFFFFYFLLKRFERQNRSS